MEPRLTGFDRAEALRYLGCGDGSISGNMAGEMDRCGQLLLQTARPRAVWRLFGLLPDGTLGGTDFRPEGNDIRAHLKDCAQVIMMAATLGAEVETLLRRTQVEDMGRALILDACAGAAIENVCDNLCADLAAAFAPKYLTDRFSPGYGDFPFTQQPDFCRVLDVTRRIGVSLSPGGFMIPQKSVTALIGVADKPQRKRAKSCESCSMFDKCTYRKDGKSCGAN